MKAHIKGARMLHIISAFWTLALALLIFGDVMGRIMLTRPIPGTKEILQNSIVTITFLQIPLAIYSGSMLRTTILSDAVPPTMRRILRTLASLLGLALFLALIWGTIPSFYDAYRIGEYEGEGSLARTNLARARRNCGNVRIWRFCLCLHDLDRLARRIGSRK